MKPQTKETRSAVADVLNDQMDKFLKRLESQDYAPSGVGGYRRRLNEFCDEVKARGVPLEQLDEKRALELFAAVDACTLHGPELHSLPNRTGRCKAPARQQRAGLPQTGL